MSVAVVGFNYVVQIEEWKFNLLELGLGILAKYLIFFFPQITIKICLFVVLNNFAPINFFLIMLNMRMHIKSDSLFGLSEPHGLADSVESF